MHCSICLLYISLLDKVFSGCVRQAFFSFGRQKKVVTGCIRQVVVLHSKDFTGICLDRLSIGRLTEVVV